MVLGCRKQHSCESNEHLYDFFPFSSFSFFINLFYLAVDEYSFPLMSQKGEGAVSNGTHAFYYESFNIVNPIGTLWIYSYDSSTWSALNQYEYKCVLSFFIIEDKNIIRNYPQEPGIGGSLYAPGRRMFPSISSTGHCTFLLEVVIFYSLYWFLSRNSCPTAYGHIETTYDLGTG